MKKLMVATPMYGGVCTAHYTYSMLNLTRLAKDINLDINFIFSTKESLITRARNTLVNTFLNSEYSHLLFIDADIAFNAEDVIKLMDHNLDIVCGGYSAKIIDWDYISQAVTNGVPANNLDRYASPVVYNKKNSDKKEVDNLLEVDNAGTGFMMIKRTVFDQLSDYVDEYTSNQFDNNNAKIKEYFSTAIVNNILLSEDYYFCHIWKKMGGKIFIDKSIDLTHIGPFEYKSGPMHWTN